MNDYTERQEARRNRLQERADKKRQAARAAQDRSDELVACIPMGQPILAGHHSEGAHRRRLERSHNAMFKSVDLNHEADRLDQRAAAVGTGGISADDPGAVEQLQHKLTLAQNMQDTMKRINKQYKKGGWDVVEGFSPEQIENAKVAMERDWRSNPRPFEEYQLKNNNANIRRIKQRIKELQAATAFEDAREEFSGFVLMTNTQDNRVRIEFDRKPNKTTCRFMHKQGFVFSRQHLAWQRQLNQRGLHVGKTTALQLVDMEVYD